MQVERCNAKPLTLAEQQELAKLKVMIDRAVADGVITSNEMTTIKATIAADGKVLIEELDLVRELIRAKIDRGEIVYDWS
ncbi:hypothetical protein [Pantanalinema sp. GBBB05]|uniref:hypothetical protein n=1 Tax=Pantanalinema sp. GBBB05 TaxID=2604139 RepID=UPI001D2D5009|nr:hypothetical protein [Pantanalinema sp. GBBB05]